MDERKFYNLLGVAGGKFSPNMIKKKFYCSSGMVENKIYCMSRKIEGEFFTCVNTSRHFLYILL